jgi:hypothetical protein
VDCHGYPEVRQAEELESAMRMRDVDKELVRILEFCEELEPIVFAQWESQLNRASFYSQPGCTTEPC